MLPLLDYSAKKAQMLREYHAQLAPQLAQDEPWADAHARAMLSGEAQVLLREMVQLYTNLLRLDEIHHYGARTSPQYPYEHQEKRIEDLFRQLHDLLEKGVAVAAQLERHGYPPQGVEDVAQCLHALDVLLADESPIYTSEAFQTVLQQSLDDVKASRVVEMTPEQL